MAKIPIPLAPDLKPDRRRATLLPIISIVVMAPLLAPLILEAAALCYCRWRAVMGTPVDVRTPVLDSIEERIESVRSDLWNALSARFQRVPWSPKVVLPIATLIMALAMVMLRL
jgi:hypothetical protein